MRKETPGRKRAQMRRAASDAARPKLARDADGFVHTARGFLPRESYERIRVLNPGLLPAFDLLPVL